MEEKISLIVPVYNVAPYLEHCIDSLLNQTYKNLEILLIDDGSTDGSGAVCDRYARAHERIRVVHTENRGLSAARNTGIELALGEYLGFVDSDDYVHEEFLSELYRTVKTSGCRMAECRALRVEGDVPPQCETKEHGTEVLGYRDWGTETDLKGFLSVTVWNKLVDRRLFEKIRFPEGRVHEDVAVTYRLVYLAGNLARIRTPLYFYRQRATGIIKSEDPRKKETDYRTALEEQIAFYEEKGERELADFARARLCLFLIGCYAKVDGKGKNTYHTQTGKLYGEISNRKTLPKKYRGYIRVFLLCPQLFKAESGREKG